jgi:hypothetical protein
MVLSGWVGIHRRFTDGGLSVFAMIHRHRFDAAYRAAEIRWRASRDPKP